MGPHAAARVTWLCPLQSPNLNGAPPRPYSTHRPTGCKDFPPKVTERRRFESEATGIPRLSLSTRLAVPHLTLTN